MLGNDGYKQFKEGSTDIDEMYDHCLMFQTYANYRSWTANVDGSRMEMTRITDSLAVAYFKDPWFSCVLYTLNKTLVPHSSYWFSCRVAASMEYLPAVPTGGPLLPGS